MAYDLSWRILQVDNEDGLDAMSPNGTDYVGKHIIEGLPSYVVALRRESSNLTNNRAGTTFENKWYPLQVSMMSVVAVVTDSDALAERVQ